MTSERWEDVFTLFDAAVARSEAERAAFLADACGEDVGLREKVESLLAIARLSHPHICALHDLGQHDGVDFLVME